MQFIFGKIWTDGVKLNLIKFIYIEIWTNYKSTLILIAFHFINKI